MADIGGALTISKPAAAPSRSPGAWARIAPRLDRVGVVIAMVAAGALAFGPFATFRANRIVSGKGLGLFSALAPATAAIGFAILLTGAGFALWRSRAGYRLAV